MKKKKNFMIYCGNSGIGKTQLCAAMVEWAIENFNNFRFHREYDLLQKVRESIDMSHGDYVKTLKLLLDDDLIFLDDIGGSGVNEWRSEILFEAVDYRYNSMKPTVITSNFSVAEFKQTYHPRLCSRLFAKENVVIEILEGEDFRQK